MTFNVDSTKPNGAQEASLDCIQLMRGRMTPYVRQTPLLPSGLASGLYLKAENLQHTQSFKVRAAAGQILSLSQASRSMGLVTSSSGNFGQAAAFVCNQLEIPLTVVMERTSNPHKIALTKDWGAKVVFCESHPGARQQMVHEIGGELDRTEIHPYDHQNAVLGNASLGLEIFEQLPQIQNIIVPISGGGLISGIAHGLKIVAPNAKVWGVQPEGANAAYLSFQSGKVCELERIETLADGLRAHSPGTLNFKMIQAYVDEIRLVSEESILDSVKSLLHFEKLLVEPSGAITVAAVVDGTVPADGTVAVLSGGNIDPALLLEIAT